MVSFGREISHLGDVYRRYSLGPWIGHNLNLSNEKNFPFRPRVVVHDVGTVVHVESRGRVTCKVLAVAISGKLGCTIRWSHLGGRYLIWVMCIGDTAWARGSDTI